MEEHAFQELYKKYLEEVLNVSYKKVFIRMKSPAFFSDMYLCRADGTTITPVLDSIKELDNGKYFLGIETLPTGDIDNIFFNSNGEVINRIKNVYIDDFHEGIARLTTIGRDKKCGYIDMEGNLIGKVKWGTESGPFKSGRARVSSTELGSLGKYGFIDKQGNLVIPCTSFYYSEYSDGVVCLDNGSLMTYFNENGKELFKTTLSQPNFQEGLVKFQNEKGKWGFKNKKGEVVISPKFQSVGNFCNGYASLDGGNIDLTGKKVKLVSYDDLGVKYEKGFLKNRYYNNKKNTYENFSFIPYKDIGDYLLCIKDSEFLIYSKESGVSTLTGIPYEHGNFSFMQVGNLISINGIVFSLSPQKCLNLSTVINLNNVLAVEDNPTLVSYDDFKANVIRDKNFYNRVLDQSKEEKKKRIENETLMKQISQDKQRQEILDQLESLKSKLSQLDKSAGNLSKIDTDLLLKQVGDHLEINPEFREQLSFLDLSCIDFTNVKVSDYDFSGTNADINPQTVYQKNMSNGNYQGLNFISKNFKDVNIKGSSFVDCNMDFAILEGAITDDNTKFTEYVK